MPFVRREMTFSLFDRQRLVGCSSAGVVLFFFKIIIFRKIWYGDQKDVSSGMLLEGSAPYLSELRSAFVSKCILHPCKETPFVINCPVWP